MDENKLQWAPAGLERFSRLEEKIFQTVEEIKAIRKENDDLCTKNSLLNEQVNEQIKGNEALRCEIDRLTAQNTGEYEKLRSENNGLLQQIETMRQSETETLELLAQFEKEREELRDRVERTLTLLKSLDDH